MSGHLQESSVFRVQAEPNTASIIRSAGLDVPGCQDMPNKELTLDGTPKPSMELSEGLRRRLNRSYFGNSCGNTARRSDDEFLIAVLLALSRLHSVLESESHFCSTSVFAILSGDRSREGAMGMSSTI